ncbi:MAG: DUF190 domain-containing protein [Pyrinomonadaceae bacterium]|nr:DUF190 domain-containing protein [Pyrinomonadaceae bacterium]
MNVELDRESKLLRIFIGESDKYDGQPLYEAIVFAAKKAGIAGATVLRGVMSYGANSRIHTAKLLDLSADLPIVVEMVDHHDRIDDFLTTLREMIESSGSGALVTLERIEVLHYGARKG